MAGGLANILSAGAGGADGIPLAPEWRKYTKTQFCRPARLFLNSPKHASFTCPRQLANDAYTQCLRCSLCISVSLSAVSSCHCLFFLQFSTARVYIVNKAVPSSCEWNATTEFHKCSHWEIVNHLARSKIATLPAMHVNEQTWLE